MKLGRQAGRKEGRKEGNEINEPNLS